MNERAAKELNDRAATNKQAVKRTPTIPLTESKLTPKGKFTPYEYDEEDEDDSAGSSPLKRLKFSESLDARA